MKAIDLFPQTIEKIKKILLDECDVNCEKEAMSSELIQGTDTICIEYEVYGRFVEDLNYHSEVLYNQNEDLSHYEYETTILCDIYAHDKEGNELEITNKNVVF